MMVESVDGSKALLGRSHKIRNSMMTALAGFVDQCESIEEVRMRPAQRSWKIDIMMTTRTCSRAI
jgi:NAD+ diphosphatase